ARSERERLQNRRLTSAVKTHYRRLEAAAQAGDDAVIQEEHRLLVSRIDKAVQRGVLHANNGARKRSRAARIRSGA
ncbi:MAG: 30S ribosomal protein S20, partial [SAR324 cluster bacterium]|nr:30S ribosomal protein S20 [SAR324 cluster bacterium]